MLPSERVTRARATNRRGAWWDSAVGARPHRASRAMRQRVTSARAAIRPRHRLPPPRAGPRPGGGRGMGAAARAPRTHWPPLGSVLALPRRTFVMTAARVGDQQTVLLSLIAMRQLIVRNVPPEVVTRLKRRAAEHGRSAEAEHREILKQALLGPSAAGSLKALLLSMPNVGEDEDFARPRSRRRRVVL